MVGQKIRELRKSLGLNQTQFAERLYVTPGAVSLWENGQTMPGVDRLTSISKTFGVPISYFTEETKEENKAPKTIQARILASGIDRMPERDRERALNMVRLMFEQYAEFFDAQEGDDDNGA